ncbi:hypothetical protein PHYBLDRAFT_146881 [Phycomyces blakesleeanus NRRL 1555(-)]|uniref:Uncharacterized protein n=1 Tax=Phycomyces blakesleeanus (strain ATCC 8743b / DSM 1359 / FGSC 10004 / NBRC 33097 / NRRL 1555) TaxID=763407 RepID=A0A162TXZ9_PHYB8|nr:hypothetical protein PHYBLDRAFT_146881 [Phycomyces blakesleeanus NRRL 1555(-)]OAD71902.1 hypothetical protein PHYBLDRAFT_146881 [Phycomyces blakesleeanus NRRL 1555(-)]|eukprot:XP_018289942.1 hypothetical protein PHYBLDRAFT_146881 [Phycomyces blakesleeanus NRRL 1555(-)]
MVIEEDESIIDYGTRFQKACHEGNIQDSNHLAMRFLSSLTSNLSANVKLAWFASHSKMPQLVKQELTLASSIAAVKPSNTDAIEHITSMLEHVSFEILFGHRILQKKTINLPIVKVEEYLVFAEKNQTSKRLRQSVSLEVTYANGHNFTHSFELMETNESDNDLILGQDIMPKLGIALAGVAIDWNTKNISQKQQEAFRKAIASYTVENKAIPKTSFCMVPEPVIDEVVNNWLNEGTIVRALVNTAWNSSLTLADKKDTHKATKQKKKSVWIYVT